MSQHMVSVVELLGLVVGLLGFFYLSLSGDMFGKRGPSIVRPILPGLAFALYIVLSFYALPPVGFTRDRPHALSLLGLAVLTLVSFAAGYFIAFLSQQVSYSKRQFFRVLILYGAMSLLGSFTATIVQYVRGGERIPLTMSVLLHLLVIMIGTIAITFAILLGPNLLKERVMKAIGIMATLLAILAQFLPPILDLLNIPITKP